MFLFCLTAGDTRLCRVGEVHLGRICLKVVAKFTITEGGLYLEKGGNWAQPQQPGKQQVGGYGGVAQQHIDTVTAGEEENEGCTGAGREL